LFDDTEETLDPEKMCVKSDGIVRALVRGGRFEAKFTRHAQQQLGRWLVDDDPPTLEILGKRSKLKQEQ